jgi:hypothetical protein
MASSRLLRLAILLIIIATAIGSARVSRRSPRSRVSSSNLRGLCKSGMDEKGIEAVIGHQRTVKVLRNRLGCKGSFGGQTAKRSASFGFDTSRFRLA